MSARLAAGVSCKRRACGNITRDFSGLCHHHRGTASATGAGLGLLAPPPSAAARAPHVGQRLSWGEIAARAAMGEVIEVDASEGEDEWVTVAEVRDAPPPNRGLLAVHTDGGILYYHPDEHTDIRTPSHLLTA